MKKLQIAVLVVFTIGCSEEQISSDQPGSISIETSIDGETNDINFNGRIETELNEIAVSILDSEGAAVQSFDDATQLPNEIELAPGTYSVIAMNKQTESVAFEAPSFSGTSVAFEVVSSENQTVDVVVSLINVKMTVNFTTSVSENFSDYGLNATSSDGSLNFDEAETRAGYFVAGNDITVVAEIGNLSATSTISSPSAADHYIINVSYTPSNGSAGINITIDDSTNDISLDLNIAPTIWSGPDFTFSKASGADPTMEANQDRISDLVWLTRGNNGGQIYNAKTESSASKSTSPAGTEWAVGTTADLANLSFDNFRSTVRPKNSAGTDLVLHLIEEDIYLDIKFESWASGRQGGFSYTRATE